MIKSNNYYYWFISYITITSSIYHIVYWSYFNLNGLSLISVTDIVKSSIYPLLITSFLFIILTSISTFFYHKKIESKIESPIKKVRRGALILNISSLIFLVIISYNFPEMRFMIIITYLIGIFYGICIFFQDKIFDLSFKTTLSKRIIILIFVPLPLISSYIGHRDAKQILDNSNFQFTTIPSEINPPIKDTLKFIGISNDKYVFINFNNSKVYFIKSDTLQIEFKN